VITNDKQRFSLSEDAQLIRANQGHSVDVELGYEAVEPPEILYHGTAERFLGSIKREGLVKGKRHHVHWSKDVATAKRVGQRHRKVVVLEVACGKMHREGHSFYLSNNGVWLTEYVPPEYLRDVTPYKRKRPEVGWSVHMTGDWQSQLDCVRRWYTRASQADNAIDRWDFLYAFF